MQAIKNEIDEILESDIDPEAKISFLSSLRDRATCELVRLRKENYGDNCFQCREPLDDYSEVLISNVENHTTESFLVCSECASIITSSEWQSHYAKQIREDLVKMNMDERIQAIKELHNIFKIWNQENDADYPVTFEPKESGFELSFNTGKHSLPFIQRFSDGIIYSWLSSDNINRKLKIER